MSGRLRLTGPQRLSVPDTSPGSAVRTVGLHRFASGLAERHARRERLLVLPNLPLEPERQILQLPAGGFERDVVSALGRTGRVTAALTAIGPGDAAGRFPLGAPVVAGLVSLPRRDTASARSQRAPTCSTTSPAACGEGDNGAPGLTPMGVRS